MKIGILIHEIDQIGGMGIAVFEEVRSLRQMGMEAELIVLIENKKIDIAGFTKDIPIRYLSREFPRMFRRGARIPPFNFFSTYHLTSPHAACRVLKENEYDCIVSHGTFNCFTAARVARKKNIPYVAFIWDPISYIVPRVYKKTALRYAFWFFLPLTRYFDRKFMDESLATVTCSKAHVEVLKGLSQSYVSVVHPGCYPATVLPAKRQDYILSLSRWDSAKNVEFLLEVLRRLKNTRVKWVMAGNWAQDFVLESFLKKAKGYGLKDRIELVGRVDDQAKARLFSEARVLVHPIFEAFGMFGLEAASFGCPLIIPRGSGVTDLFIHEKHGFFPQEGDVDSFVNYINLLIEDEGLSRKMGERAWKVSLENTWLDHSRKLLAVIERGLKNERSASSGNNS